MKTKSDTGSIVRFCRLGAFMAICGFTMMAAAQRADAANGFLVSVWQNDTPFTVGGRYHWGDGPWRDFRIEPGNSYATWFPNDGRNVPLYIEFDADPGPGIEMVRYHLRTYFSPTTILDNGPTERFFQRPDGRIELGRTQP